MVELAVVIVTWNSQAEIGDALESLLNDLEASFDTYRVLVVDGASTDRTVSVVETRFPTVDVIQLGENIGFGQANNAGLAHLGFSAAPDEVNTLPQAVYLLNPDTVTKSGATRALYDALMAQPDVGLVGANLRYGDDSFQHGAFKFPGLRQIWAEFFPTPGRFIEGRFNGRYPRANYAAGKPPFNVDFVLGAAMMLKRDVLLQVGGFDPIFFMYAEEVDLAWRIHGAGWAVQSVPSAHVVHLSGQSTSQVSARSVIHLWESRLKLFKRIMPSWKYAVARWLIIQGMQRKLTQLPPVPDEDAAAIRNAYQKVIHLARYS